MHKPVFHFTQRVTEEYHLFKTGQFECKLLQNSINCRSITIDYFIYIV